MSIETQAIGTASIRDRALAALTTRRQLEAEAAGERARRDQEREAEQRGAVVARFQAQLDQRGFAGVVATDATVEVGGVTLAFRQFNSGHGIVALAPCRECGMTGVHSVDAVALRNVRADALNFCVDLDDLSAALRQVALGHANGGDLGLIRRRIDASGDLVMRTRLPWELLLRQGRSPAAAT